MGRPTGGDIGHMQALFLTSGMGYAFGGLLFGIALFRAGLRDIGAVIDELRTVGSEART